MVVLALEAEVMEVVVVVMVWSPHPPLLQPILQRLFYLICVVLAALAQGLWGLFYGLIPGKAGNNLSAQPQPRAIASVQHDSNLDMLVREEEPWVQGPGIRVCTKGQAQGSVPL